jgi:AcrR family transcriptional regulator
MPADAPGRRDRRAERHAATKTEIVDAAWRLAEQQGLTGWSLRDVADIVGIRQPSLYVYFDSKNALYDAMFAAGYQDMLEQIAATEVDPDPVRMLHRAARVFLDFAVERPARYYLLFLRPIPGFEPSPESYQLALASLESLREVLATVGVRDGAHVDLFTALMSGLATQQVSNDPGGDRWSRLLDAGVDMFLVATGVQPQRRDAKSSTGPPQPRRRQPSRKGRADS